MTEQRGRYDAWAALGMKPRTPKASGRKKQQVTLGEGGASEADFTATVLELAQWGGWLTAHFRPALTQDGHWVTPVAGDGVGFPDLVLVKGTELIIAELKSATGRLRPEQTVWLDRLRDAETIAVEVWRPRDLATIRERLGVAA